jgi:hypothetical protein
MLVFTGRRSAGTRGYHPDMAMCSCAPASPRMGSAGTVGTCERLRRLPAEANVDSRLGICFLADRPSWLGRRVLVGRRAQPGGGPVLWIVLPITPCS